MVQFSAKEVFVGAFLLSLFFVANPMWVDWSIWVFGVVCVAFVLHRFGVFGYIWSMFRG